MLVAAHGNSIRAIVKYIEDLSLDVRRWIVLYPGVHRRQIGLLLEGHTASHEREDIPDDVIPGLEIPTGTPSFPQVLVPAFKSFLEDDSGVSPTPERGITEFDNPLRLVYMLDKDLKPIPNALAVAPLKS